MRLGAGIDDDGPNRLVGQVSFQTPHGLEHPGCRRPVSC
jgi:hypothetical protein